MGLKDIVEFSRNGVWNRLSELPGTVMELFALSYIVEPFENWRASQVHPEITREGMINPDMPSGLERSENPFNYGILEHSGDVYDAFFYNLMFNRALKFLVPGLSDRTRMYLSSGATAYGLIAKEAGLLDGQKLDGWDIVGGLAGIAAYNLIHYAVNKITDKIPHVRGDINNSGDGLSNRYP